MQHRSHFLHQAAHLLSLAGRRRLLLYRTTYTYCTCTCRYMSVKKTLHVVLIMHLLVMCELCGHVYGSAFSHIAKYTWSKTDEAPTGKTSMPTCGSLSRTGLSSYSVRRASSDDTVTLGSASCGDLRVFCGQTGAPGDSAGAPGDSPSVPGDSAVVDSCLCL